MLCVEDYLDALDWAKSIGGLEALIARADANAARARRLGRRRPPGSDFLAVDPETRSNTSVCLTIVDPAVAGARRRRPGGVRQGARRACSRRKASPTTSAPIATRRRACASGAARRSRPSDLEALTALARLGLRHAEGGARKAAPELPRRRSRAATSDDQSSRKEADHGATRSRFRQAFARPPSQIFKDRGVEVDYQPDLGKDKDKLLEVIGKYDGLAIRSATKVTEKLIAAATNLKVIGRAGIGVDNVDIPAATAAGIIVMNTPFGNSITTAEHAIAHDVRAGAPDPRGRTPRPRPASGRRTASWASRSPARRSASSAAAISARSSPTARIGLKMQVIAFDPFLSEERAAELGVEKVELDELFAPRRLHHAAHAADRQDQQHHRRRRRSPR